jgi:hypothetical protein
MAQPVFPARQKLRGDSRRPGDAELDGNGRDATRVVLAVTDSAGNFRPFATGTFP